MLIAFDKEKAVNSPLVIVKILQSWLKTVDKVDREKEHFIVIHLNTRSKIKDIEIVSIGITNSAIVHPREVFRRAIFTSTSQIIMAHNHPSNDCTPSDEDIAVTKRIKEAGEIVGIQLLDHLIFSKNAYYSLLEHDEV